MPEFYIGLMSGTSLDGVDAVLADFSGSKCLVTQHQSAQLAPELKAELLTLNTSGADELHRAALAANALVRVYAETVQALLAHSGIHASAVRAIGAHGQTVRHRPQAFDGTGYTLQLNNPALLAELTGISVIADFRSRDVAAGLPRPGRGRRGPGPSAGAGVSPTCVCPAAGQHAGAKHWRHLQLERAGRCRRR